ncbi:MAG: stage III sporulation AC/AD family protein [Oscillospiraceae bacterium]|nr:stage III sporulation AC/AD family protein [Oscillospiraceae bacterium]
MDIVIKGAAVGIISAVCALLIKKSNQEIGLVIAIAASAVICIAAAELFGSISDLIRYAISKSGLSSAIFLPIIKCVGIAIIVNISASLCKDAGQAGIASAVDVLGAAAAVFTALPLIKSLIEIIGELV